VAAVVCAVAVAELLIDMFCATHQRQWAAHSTGGGAGGLLWLLLFVLLLLLSS
jgi:hypothetical protein